MEGQEISILDCVLTNNKLTSTAMEMMIDENNQYGVLKLQKIRKPYSDYNEILLNLKLHNYNRKTKEEQSNYQICIQKI